MKLDKLAAIAALAFSFAQAAPAQVLQSQSCKRHPRIAQGQDVGIRRAPDDSMWYAAQSANRIVKIDKKMVETPFVPVNGATNGISGLAFDGKGNIWYSKTHPGVVGKFPTEGGEGVEYAIPLDNAFPVGLIPGPDGALWFYSMRNSLGRVGADGGITLIPVNLPNTNWAPYGMAAGIDNSLWITEHATNSVLRFDIATKAIKRYDIPEPNAQPRAIRVAKNGVVWFVMGAVNKIGTLENGRFTSISLGKESPRGLHIHDDQSVWVTTNYGFLERFKPDGSRERYKCDNVSGPLATSSDGTVYAMAGGDMMVLKPGDAASAPQIASSSNVQAPRMLPLGRSPVRTVTLPELRKLFEMRPRRLVVHYTVPSNKGCVPCDESAPIFEEFARRNTGKAEFVRIANEYSEAAWSDPWYQMNAKLTGVPSIITYYDAKEAARVDGQESLEVLNARLLPAR